MGMSRWTTGVAMTGTTRSALASLALALESEPLHAGRDNPAEARTAMLTIPRIEVMESTGGLQAESVPPLSGGICPAPPVAQVDRGRAPPGRDVSKTRHLSGFPTQTS